MMQHKSASFFIYFGMKKFKFKKKKNNYIIILLFVLFIIVFILLSKIRLTKSNTKFIKYLLTDISLEEKNINLLTSNLNIILNTYYFKENNDLVVTNNRVVYLYNSDISNYLKQNLEKLNIDVTSDNSNKYIGYYINIENGNNDSTMKINDKEYSKIDLIVNNRNIIEKIKKCFDKKYQDLFSFIFENNSSLYNKDTITFKINSKNKETINNSTEIVSLLLYYILGESNEQIF